MPHDAARHRRQDRGRPRPVRSALLPALTAAAVAVTALMGTAASHEPPTHGPHSPTAGAGTPPPPAPPAPSGGTTASRPDTTGERARVVRLVNTVRSEAGCPALELHPGLTKAAQRHSAHMARTGILSHDGPGGTSLAQRLEDVRYDGRKAAENIARDYPEAESAVAAWMKSRPHRHNILSCAFREIGVGITADDSGGNSGGNSGGDSGYGSGHGSGLWWTQIMGAPR